jgi:hypothetical protein
MNRWLAALLGGLAGAALAAGGLALAWKVRGESRRELAPTPGRYQVHSARRLLLLDSATGELWAWRQGAWRRAAPPPVGGAGEEPAGEEPIFWEEVPGPQEAGGEPPAPRPAPAQPAPAAEPRGRADVIQVPPEQAPGVRR